MRFGSLVHFVDNAPARETHRPASSPHSLLSEANAFARLGHRLDWSASRSAARAAGAASWRERLKLFAAIYAGARLSESP